MKTTKAFLVAAVALAAVTAYTSSAQAQQDVTVNASVSVQNALRLTVEEHLNFGSVVAVGDPDPAGVTSTLSISPVTNVLTPANAAPSLFSVIDSTDAQAAHITVENGAPGSVLTVEIDNVNPVRYTDAGFNDFDFTLTGFSTTWNNIGAPVPRTVGLSWPQTFDAVGIGAGVNQLNIGATLSTIAGTTYPIGDGTPQVYTGAFDVIFQY